jgi:hypothetical protein
MDTLIEQGIEQRRELLACMEALRLTAQSPIMLIQPLAAVRAIARCVAIRLHAARSAIEDSAARLVARVPSRASIGTAVRGSSLLGVSFKVFETQGARMNTEPAVYVLSGALKHAIRTSRVPQIELGARVGMHQPRLSALLRGLRFSDHTRAAVVMLGASLGVQPAACVRYVGKRRTGNEAR